MNLGFVNGGLLQNVQRVLVLCKGVASALFAGGNVMNLDALVHLPIAEFRGGLMHLLEVVQNVPVAIGLSLHSRGARVRVVGALDVVDLALLRLLALGYGPFGSQQRGRRQREQAEHRRDRDRRERLPCHIGQGRSCGGQIRAKDNFLTPSG